VDSDDDVFLALSHESGVRSHLWASVMAAQPGARMRVTGTRGAYVKQQGDVQEAALRAGARPGALGWGDDPSENWGVFSDGATAQAVKSANGAYQDFYAGMAAALCDGVAVPVDPEDAVAGLEIIEAARRSASQRAVIKL
jgi:predicted dehydrogenase